MTSRYRAASFPGNKTKKAAAHLHPCYSAAIRGSTDLCFVFSVILVVDTPDPRASIQRRFPLSRHCLRACFRFLFQ